MIMTTIYHQDIASKSHAGVKYLANPAPFFSPSLPGRVVAMIKTAIERRIQRTTDRQAFSHLLALDQHTLDDIGITRDDVFWASRLPLSINASHELEKIARSNKNLQW
jgi:uncharacterized protein YjiS (DUF1127 family)